MLSRILEIRRVVGQRFEPPSHTDTMFEKKVISARSSTLEKNF